VNAGVRISTEGDQYVGELTPGNAKLSTLVGGRAATIEVLSGKALTDVTQFRASPCVLKITEPIMSEWKVNSTFSVEVFDEAGKKDPSITMTVGQVGTATIINTCITSTASNGLELSSIARSMMLTSRLSPSRPN
jgi:hypothetical protein